MRGVHRWPVRRPGGPEREVVTGEGVTIGGGVVAAVFLAKVSLYLVSLPRVVSSALS